jgi:hypothetical protein
MAITNAAKEEQGDVAYGHTPRLGYQRVRQLVGQHRGKEKQRRDQSQPPLDARAPFGVKLAEHKGQVPGHQHQDEQPAKVDLQGDPEQASDP